MGFVHDEGIDADVFPVEGVVLALAEGLHHLVAFFNEAVAGLLEVALLVATVRGHDRGVEFFELLGKVSRDGFRAVADEVHIRVRHDDGVPVTGGHAGSEAGAGLGVVAARRRHEDLGLWVGFAEGGGELVDRAVLHHDDGFAGLAEAAEFHREGNLVVGLPGADTVGHHAASLSDEAGKHGFAERLQPNDAALAGEFHPVANKVRRLDTVDLLVELTLGEIGDGNGLAFELGVCDLLLGSLDELGECVAHLVGLHAQLTSHMYPR